MYNYFYKYLLNGELKNSMLIKITYFENYMIIFKKNLYLVNIFFIIY